MLKINDEQLQKLINDPDHVDTSHLTKNYGFSSIDDEQLQKIIDNSLLEALSAVGETCYQKDVNKWNNEMEHHVKKQENMYQQKMMKSRVRSMIADT